MRVPAPQSGRRSNSSGRASVIHEDRDALRPGEEVLDEVEQAAVSPLEVLEEQDARATGGDRLEEHPPAREEDVTPSWRGGADAEEREEGGLDPAAVLRVGNPIYKEPVQGRPRRRLVVALGKAGPPADHLAEGPEGQPVPVGRAAALVPPDRLDEAVDVLAELPGQAALADPGRSGDRDEPGAAVPPGRVKGLLERPQLLVAADKGRLEDVRAVAATPLGDHPHGAPGPHGRGLALEGLLAGRLEGDRARRRPHRRLPDEDGPWLRRRLQAAGAVHEVAGHHPLVRRPERDRGLAGQDAGPGLDRRPERADGVHEFETGPDRPLRVVLVGDRRAPDRHHRVADELLERAPVTADHGRGELEVPRQGLAHLLGVALLGERGEPDEVGKEDRHEATFRDGRGGGRTECRCRYRQRRRALAAETGCGPVGGAAGWAG